MRHLLQPCARTGLGAALTGLALLAGSAAVQAQSAACQDIAKNLQERRSIVERLQKLGKGGKIDPRVACTGFTQLVSNGSAIMKWMEANASWCQVPDSFVENMRADHRKSSDLRAKACKVAQQQAQMERRAREGGGAPGQQGGGLLGGPGLEGTYRLPQGAL